jgi:Flp pilus assembly protein TadG
MSYRSQGAQCRRGAAAVEAAIVMPVLVLLAVVAFDYCRVFQYYEVVANCARAAAIWSADPTTQSQSPYASYTAAALAEWPYDPSLLTVTATPVTGSDGNKYIDAQASYTFNTVVSYLGVPATVNVTQTVRVRVEQATPNDL